MKTAERESKLTLRNDVTGGNQRFRKQRCVSARNVRKQGRHRTWKVLSMADRKGIK
jgi:hypothetical protein